MKKQLTQEQIIKKLEKAGVRLTKNFDLNQPNCSYPIGKDKRILTINGLKRGDIYEINNTRKRLK